MTEENFKKEFFTDSKFHCKICGEKFRTKVTDISLPFCEEHKKHFKKCLQMNYNLNPPPDNKCKICGESIDNSDTICLICLEEQINDLNED